MHWDGTGWSTVQSPTLGSLYGVWGSGPDDVWAVGMMGTLLHRTEGGWVLMDSGTDENLKGIWGRGPPAGGAGGAKALAEPSRPA